MREIRLVVTLVMLLGSPGLWAHHGPVTNASLYDTDELVELEGEMTEVFWHNPHTRGRLEVVEADGEVRVWEVELGAGPRSMEGRGLAAEDFLGPMKVAGFVARRGNSSFGALHVLLPNGEEMTRSDRPLRWSNVMVRDGSSTIIDPARVTRDRETATSIFRMWETGRGAGPERDLSMDWLTERGREAAATYDPVADNREINDCRQGMPDMMFDPPPLHIVDNGDRITLEAAEYNTTRTIYMDTAASPEPEFSRTGYSTGRWVGDTLFVTTTNVDWPFYSDLGFPQSNQVTYLERFSVSDDGSFLHHSITITDPVMATRPFTIERTREWAPGAEIPPYNCVVDWEEGAAITR
ncbi:MAG: DUF6152 family protein [Candidatus Rariloculaceae bacterium]